jgi:hypothetical protein
MTAPRTSEALSTPDREWSDEAITICAIISTIPLTFHGDGTDPLVVGINAGGNLEFEFLF